MTLDRASLDTLRVDSTGWIDWVSDTAPRPFDPVEANPP